MNSAKSELTFLAANYRRNTNRIERGALQALRTLFPILQSVLPGFASALAVRIHGTPPRPRMPTREQPYLRAGRQVILDVQGTPLVTYHWGEGERRVLLSHAWGGRATQLGAFISPLIRRGCHVIGFDAPGHGQSAGGRVDLPQVGHAIDAVVRAFGVPQGVIGHSFGAGAAALTASYAGYAEARLALIGCFSEAEWLTDRFIALLNLPHETGHRLREDLRNWRVRHWGGKPLSVGDALVEHRGAVMLVHDADDAEIPLSQFAELQKKLCGFVVPTLLTTEGLGHRRIVRDDFVVEKVVEFLSRE